jgi:hypothetical protein
MPTQDHKSGESKKIQQIDGTVAPPPLLLPPAEGGGGWVLVMVTVAMSDVAPWLSVSL